MESKPFLLFVAQLYWFRFSETVEMNTEHFDSKNTQDLGVRVIFFLPSFSEPTNVFWFSQQKCLLGGAVFSIVLSTVLFSGVFHDLVHQKAREEGDGRPVVNKRGQPTPPYLTAPRNSRPYSIRAYENHWFPLIVGRLFKPAISGHGRC